MYSISNFAPPLATGQAGHPLSLDALSSNFIMTFFTQPMLPYGQTGWSRKKRVFEGGFRPPKNINELFTLFTPRALLLKWGLWMTGHPIPGTKSGIIFFRHIIPKRSFG